MNPLEHIKRGEALAEAQRKELELLVKNEKSRQVIGEVMATVLIGFLALDNAERCLVVKFLVETVTHLEEIK